MKLNLTRLAFSAFLIILSAVLNRAQAQNTIMYADVRADFLAEKQAKINKLSTYKSSGGMYKGYRIMVLNTNDRALAYRTRAELLRFFPGNNVYLGYQAPYFKLKAGDYIKRDEAERMKKELARHFKQALYVVSELIKLTPEEEAKLAEGETK